jgi:hypothetical protein
MKIPAYALRIRAKFYTENTQLGVFKLGLPGQETLLPSPTRFRIEPKEIGSEERAADGTLNVDSIAIKDHYLLYYEMLTNAQAQTIRNELNRKTDLSFKYLDQTRTVIGLSFPCELTSASPVLWEKITLVLREK